MSTIFSLKKTPVKQHAGSGLIRSVKLFFGIKIGSVYHRSRIVRKPAKPYEEFIFKGYDQQDPGISHPRSFKKIKMIGKN